MTYPSNNGKYVPTGFEVMAEAISKGGLRPGEMCVVAGRSLGKATFVTEMDKEQEAIRSMRLFLASQGVSIDSEEEIRKFILSLASAEKVDEHYALLQRLKTENLFEKQQRWVFSKPDLRRGAFIELDSMAPIATNVTLSYAAVGGREPKPKKRAKWKQDRFASIQQSAQSKRK